jgi:hypothetical protein
VKPRIDLRAIARVDVAGRQERFQRIATITVNKWARAARNTLGGTSADYVNGITVERVDANGCTVALIGKVPNIVEQGLGPGGVGTYGAPYDLRDVMLRPGTSSLRRDEKGRLYVNIPFRHSAEDIAKLGGDMAAQAVKSLRPSRTREGDNYRPPNSNLVDPRALQARTQWGGRLGADFGPRLSGIVRMEKIHSDASRGAPSVFYITWRRMIQGGKPWMTPGVAPRRLAKQVHAASGDIIRLAGL